MSAGQSHAAFILVLETGFPCQQCRLISSSHNQSQNQTEQSLCGCVHTEVAVNSQHSISTLLFKCLVLFNDVKKQSMAIKKTKAKVI